MARSSPNCCVSRVWNWRRPCRMGGAPGTDVAAHLLRPLAVQVAELERRAIAAALAAHAGNKQATARQLGISRATLYARMENPD